MALLTLTTLLFGVCSQYDPGVMESVIRVRQSGRTAMNLPTNLPRVDGYVALKECSDIGKIVWMRKLGSDKWESFYVVDCAGIKDGGRDWMERNNIVAEIDGDTARRWDVVGRGFNVEIMMFKHVSSLAN